MSSSWIGVDLDGTLAHYDRWEGVDKIGPPIPLMLERVKYWRRHKIDVRIFTARVADRKTEFEARAAIESWCLVYLGEVLPVTCSKDYGMICLYDDRAVRVEHNTGIILFDPQGVANED